MARTKTKKVLLKAERSGTWCSANNRRSNGDYGAISQHVRITPSKKQQLNKIKHKERITYDGAPFLWGFFDLRCYLYPLSAEYSKFLG
ncbi:hypothetical protein J2T20_003988 [Paenibacillus wynnii]|nr:hypothetical protein [Paenibacillus wynnii]